MLGDGERSEAARWQETDRIATWYAKVSMVPWALHFISFLHTLPHFRSHIVLTSSSELPGQTKVHSFAILSLLVRSYSRQDGLTPNGLLRRSIVFRSSIMVHLFFFIQ